VDGEFMGLEMYSAPEKWLFSQL